MQTVSLDQLSGDDLRRAIRAIAMVHGIKTPFMIFGNGLPQLPHPNAPAFGPHHRLEWRVIRGRPCARPIALCAGSVLQ